MRRAALRVGVIVALLAAVGCTTVRRGPIGSEHGRASWYGPGFHGKRTANGEVYDMNALTAAHKKLPFGTRIEVTNVDNGRSVEVRINDRGPFVRGRIIDLSRAAAEAIGMLANGTAQVRLTILEQPVAAGFIIQAGAFSSAENAMQLLADLQIDHPEAAIYSDGDWNRVQLGPFETRREAERIAQRLQRRGIRTLVRSAG